VWAKATIGEIARNLDNLRVPLNSAERQRKSVRKLYPYIDANNIIDYLDEYIFDERILCVAEDGGSWGPGQQCAVIYEGKTWVNNHAHVLVENGKANLDYLRHFLNRTDLTKYITGTTRGKLTRTALDRIEVPLPPLPIQIRIADILNRAEALISQRKESLRLLDEFLKSTFLEMFGDPVRNEKGWDKFPLREIASVKIGPFGSLLHFEDYVCGGTPIVNPSHIIKGRIVIDDSLTVSNYKLAELFKYQMKTGDIVLGRRGEIGRCAVVGEKENGYLCGTGSMFITPSNKLNSIFLFYLLSSNQIKTLLNSLAKGVTMKNLNSNSLESLEICLPPLELQTRFVDIIQKTETLKSCYEASLQELNNFYGSLSQRAFGHELLGMKEESPPIAAEPESRYNRRSRAETES
jgi:type I restriction enzyme S subunit